MKLKSKNSYFILVFALTALLATGVFWLFKVSRQNVTKEPSQEELAEIIKPAVVRIVHHITGDASIPGIDFNLKDLSISVFRDKSVSVPLDEYFTGSGFVVNPDGYILTNAHVASPEMLKNLLVEQTVKDLISKKTDSLSDDQLKNYFHDTATVQDFRVRLLDTIEQNSSFHLKSELTVLDPSSPQEDIVALAKNGFPATVISLHDNFLKDEKDVALIKINQSHLPSLPLGNSEDMNAGQKIYVFGFPASAEFNQKTPLESTFTQGIISAIKFSQNKDFKIFQTDAKMSQGSSGGPLFNDQGKAVGIITFETGELKKDTGDNFAFAIPISLAKQILAEDKVNNDSGSYEEHFKNGLAYFHTNQCKKATEEFSKAGETNKSFAADKYINPYLEECEQLVNSGKSVDNRPALAWVWLKSVNNFVWFVVVGRAILVLLGLWVFWMLIKRMRKDEMEIDNLSTSLEQEKDIALQLIKQLRDRGVVLPEPDEETNAASRQELSIAHPHLVDYVTEARAVGLPDEHITNELKNAGWADHEIKPALGA